MSEYELTPDELTREELETIAANYLSEEDISFMEGEGDADFIGYLVGVLEAEHDIEDGVAYLMEQGAVIRSRLHQPEVKELQNRGEPFSTDDVNKMVAELERREGNT